MDFNPGDILSVYIPSRRYRRRLAGSRCAVCHLRIHHLDAAVLDLGVEQWGIHQPCSALLAEQIAQANKVLPGHEDDPAND